MVQKTLVLIKPDAMDRGLAGEVISRFEKAGFKLADLKMVQVERSLSEKHYHLDDENYLRSIGQKGLDAGDKIDDLVEQGRMIISANCDFIISRPIIAMILEGNDAVAEVRKIVGYTDPAKAEKGTIRGDLGTDNILDANREKRPVLNLVHASGTPEEAEAEIKLWFNEAGSSQSKAPLG